jgi:hypothetical protein
LEKIEKIGNVPDSRVSMFQRNLRARSGGGEEQRGKDQIFFHGSECDCVTQ